MKKLLLVLFASFAIGTVASAADYSIDEASVDAVIESAEEVSFDGIDKKELSEAADKVKTTVSARKKPIAAFLLNTFLGGFGVHRHYLGTRPGMWAIYTFTIGGIFGIIPFIDWIFLIVGLVENDISDYYDNPSFLMWA